MRYYGIRLFANAEELKEGAKINLREYGYLDPINAMNAYVRQKMVNDIHFFAYREEKNEILTVLSYQERKYSFHGNLVHYILSARSMEAANDMTGLLAESLFEADRIQGRRVELITDIACDFYTNHDISSRRSFGCGPR